MNERKVLTQRQLDVYQYIRQRTESDRIPPTVREIGETFQISSTNGVRSILGALIKKGYIRRSPRLSRGIELVSNPETSSTNCAKTLQIPIVGRVAAGQPILAVQNLEGTITVDRDFIARQENVFALQVRGDSMIEAGIFDGDLVFARQQNVAEKGQMVVAQIDDEATVKYYHPESDHIALLPANRLFSPIRVPSDAQFSIAGRVIGVMRKLG